MNDLTEAELKALLTLLARVYQSPNAPLDVKRSSKSLFTLLTRQRVSPVEAEAINF